MCDAVEGAPSWEELRQALERARAADAGLEQFGAKAHQYRWAPPAALTEVEGFEREIGTRLPEDYRAFLLQAGNGGAGPFYGLFSLEQVREAWPVESERMPQIAPQIQRWDPQGPDNWKRGCIPIGGQGCTYFTCLMVAGPDRGRVFYLEYEGAWIFFPRETTFLSWYSRWLREVIGGYDTGWFATRLDGDEAALRRHYAQASEEDERLLAITSMEKFPALSEETKRFLTGAIGERAAIPDARPLLKLAHRASLAFYHRFLDERWELGAHEAVLGELVYSLYHVVPERTDLAKRWRDRVLDALPDLPPEAYGSTLTILLQCGDVKLEQVAFLLDKAVGDTKNKVLVQLGRFPDADIRLWLPLLRQREDLELLSAALGSVPRTGDVQLREVLMEVQRDFSAGVELPLHGDLKDPKERERYADCRQKYDIYHAACSAWQDAFHEAIDPAVEGIPRPYRLGMAYHDMHDLGMDRPPPPGGIPLHPLVALAVWEERGRSPSTAYDWKRDLERTKRLKLRLCQSTVRAWDEEERRVTLRWPDSHLPPAPYYYDLRDWSAIGRMSALRDLSITEICVEDFSFLARCKELRTLSLRNTNFTDCRMLLELPKLRTMDLSLCRLTYTEALEELQEVDIRR